MECAEKITNRVYRFVHEQPAEKHWVTFDSLLRLGEQERGMYMLYQLGSPTSGSKAEHILLRENEFQTPLSRQSGTSDMICTQSAITPPSSPFSSYSSPTHCQHR